jgi:hypothetical protein
MTTQLTVRGIEPALDQRLRAEAKRRGVSLNRVTLQLLRQSLGLELRPALEAPDAVCSTDLDHLAGTWTKEDAQEFDRELGALRRIDPELWS